MRSPHRVHAEAVCRSALPALFEKHDLPTPRDVAVDELGWVNLCFFVDGTVVRFNARDPHLPKFQREVVAYRRLRDEGFPVPSVVALDHDRDVVEFDVLITERLAGANLETDLPTLPDRQRASLIAEAARWLHRLHEVEFAGFGDLAHSTPHTTWRSAMQAMFEHHLGEAGELGTLTPGELDRFRAVFQSTAPVLDAVARSALVHADYHAGNLLYAADRITGILDFEWSFAGDPAFDLAYQDNLDGMGFQHDFFAHFTLPDAPEAAARRDLYRASRNVELCNVARLHFPDHEADDYRARTLEHLARLESIG